jgi:putative ABC transport system permease protein
VAAAEIAARIALRRVVRGSPLAQLDGSDDDTAGSRRPKLRSLLGLTAFLGGLAMALAPWYASGEAATALPALSGLVMALSIGPLGPVVVRAAARVVQQPARRSAAAYLALNSVGTCPARVGGVLAPIVLGVTFACVQLFSATTIGAVAGDQVRAGLRADLVVSSSGTGIGPTTADAILDVPGVAASDAMAATKVIAHVHGGDISPQTLTAVGIATDRVERYADLAPRGGGELRVRAGEVALGVQGAAAINADPGDTVTFVLADGRSVDRHVTSIYQRGLGFGEVLLPVADLQPTTASGLPSALAVTVDDDTAPDDVEARIHELLATRPGLTVTRSTVVDGPAAVPGEASFQVLLLLVLIGYIAIAVVNSLVVAILARRSEFRLLRVVGATPVQRQQVPRWEAVFIAATACVVGTLVALPGLVGMTNSLSNGDRLVPAIDPVLYTAIVASTFALVMAATALPARAARQHT